jgi:hypothetical protein
LKEAQVLIEEWRLEYSTFRPHSSLKNRPLGTGGKVALKDIKNGRTLTLNVVHVLEASQIGEETPLS